MRLISHLVLIRYISIMLRVSIRDIYGYRDIEIYT